MKEEPWSFFRGEVLDRLEKVAIHCVFRWKMLWILVTGLWIWRRV